MAERLQPHTFRYDGEHINYLLYQPQDDAANTSATDTRWPLLLFLHGAGERGDDLDKVKVHGPPRLIAEGREFPCIVVAPQCPAEKRWSIPLLARLLDGIQAELAVDSDRIYVTGVSMGGHATWALAIAQPERFAALVPICSLGDPTQVCAIRHVPVWAFHGELDDIVSVERSREMVEALRACGGSVWYTTYPDLKHDSWTRTYANPRVFAWLFAQRRGQAPVAPGGE